MTAGSRLIQRDKYKKEIIQHFRPSERTQTALKPLRMLCGVQNHEISKELTKEVVRNLLNSAKIDNETAKYVEKVLMISFWFPTLKKLRIFSPPGLISKAKSAF